MKYKITILIIFIFYGFKLFSQYPERPLNNIAIEDYLPENVTYPFSFVVLGDTRDGSNNPALSPDFLIILDQIAELKPKFVINVGDVVYDGLITEYQVYYDTIQHWMYDNSIPFFTVPGNHEFWVENSYTQYYPNFIGNYDFSFDLENVRIIGINNCQHEDDPYIPGQGHSKPLFISNEQLTFVESKLNEPSSPPLKFGFTHVPLMLSSYINKPGYLEYYDLLWNYNVKANFCGHAHRYTRFYMCSGIFDIITGGGGASTDNIDTIPPIQHREHHFLLVTVTEDDNVKVEMYFKNDGHNEIAQQYDFIMPTSESMILENQIIHSGETRYFASQNTIEVAGNGTEFIVEDGSNVEMVASESIVLKDGFHASGNFHAYIQDLECENLDKNNTKNGTKIINIDSLEAGKRTNEDIIINRQSSICIFPNPSETGIFSIYFYGNNTTEKIEIVDITGKIVYSKTLNNQCENILPIDISDQKSGVYILKIQFNNEIITKKIIIQ